MGVGEIFFHGEVMPGEFVQFDSVVLYTSVPGNLRRVYDEVLSEREPPVLSLRSGVKSFQLVHVEVRAQIITVEERTFRPCNTFSFAFAVPRSATPLPRVLPLHQEEAKRITDRYVYDLAQEQVAESMDNYSSFAVR